MIQNTVNPSAINGKNAEQSCTLLENFSQGESSFFQHVIEQIRNVIWVVDEEGKILSVNHAAEAIYGYSVSELINMSVHDLRHIDAKSTIDEQLKLAQEDGMLFQTLHCRKSGETLAVEVSSRRMNYRERTLIVSVTRDITERVALQDELYNKKKDLQDAHERLLKAYEELQHVHEELLASDEATRQQFDELLTKERKIERHNIVLKLVNQMAMELMNRRDLGEVLHIAVRGATAMLNTAHGFVSLVDEEEGVFVRKISLGVFAEDGGDKDSLATGLLSQAYLSGEFVLAKACGQRDEQEDNMQRYCSRLIVVVPLKVGTSVIGVLGVAISEPDRILSDDEIYILQRIAELTSIAIDDAVLVQSCKQELMERTRAEAAIRRMVYYDSLTGLPNRAMLQEHLAGKWKESAKMNLVGRFFLSILTILK
ncbi:MAG: PAS domain S-box protein [Negativicutes bacterium]